MDDRAEFVQESAERITQLNNDLLAIERDPDDEEAMRRLFRTAHTLKGNAGGAGFDAASDLAHALEDLLEAVRSGRVDVSPDLMDVAFDAVDELESMVDEAAETGVIATDPGPTIEAISEVVERKTRSGATTITEPTTDEIDAVLAGLEPPTAPDFEAYLVRLAVTESEFESGSVTNGVRVLEALIDAFDVLGTDPDRNALEDGTYGGRFDAVFASAVGEEAIAAALEPIEVVADFAIQRVSDRFAALESVSTDADAPPGGEISSEEAADLSVDDLLDEFEEFDNLDEKVKEVEGDDDLEVFDEMGEAGSFDDLFAAADVEPEPPVTDDAAAIDESPPATADDGSAGDDARVSADAGSDSDGQTGTSAGADDDQVDDAEAVFAELKAEVEPVGFDELQAELEELEFDEFEEEEIGMDELLAETDDLEEDASDDAEDLEDDEAVDATTPGTDDATDPVGDDGFDVDDAFESVESDPAATLEAVDEPDDAAVADQWATTDSESDPGSEFDTETTAPDADFDADFDTALDDGDAADSLDESERSVEPDTDLEEDPDIVDAFDDASLETGSTATDRLEEADTPLETDVDDRDGREDHDDLDASDTGTDPVTDADPVTDSDPVTDAGPGTDDETPTGWSNASPSDEWTKPGEADESTDSSADDWTDSGPDDGWADANADEWIESGTEDWELESTDDWPDSSADDWSDAASDSWTDRSGDDWSETDSVDWSDHATDFDDAFGMEDEDGTDVEDDLEPGEPDTDAVPDADAGFDAADLDLDHSLEPESVPESEFGLDDSDDSSDPESASDLGTEFGFDDSSVDDGFDVDDSFDVTDALEAGADAETGVEFGDDAGTGSEFGGDTRSEPAVESGSQTDRSIDEPSRTIVAEPDLEIPDITVPSASERQSRADGDEIQSIRVDVEQIDDLLSLVEGLVTTRGRLRHAVETDLDRAALEREVEGLDSLVTDLQGTVMDVRLVPLETVTSRLPRIVRDVARDQDKQVDLELSGMDVELDRAILERLRDPLVHLVRNAVDHGIESPATREAADKPSDGQVEVSATRSRDRVAITVADDGRGLDPDALRDEAVEAGVVEPEAAEALTDSEALELAFHPGLSTAAEVTDVSGRGVGMDVVKRTIEDVDGTITIDSESGEGTTIRLTLPVSIAIDDVLFLEVGDTEFGVPTSVVQDVEPIEATETIDGERVLPVEGEAYPVLSLAETFGIGDGAAGGVAADAGSERATDGGDSTRLEGGESAGQDGALETSAGRTSAPDGMLLRIREDVRPVAIECDHVRDQQEVVVKPYVGFMGDVPGLSGATVRGRGTVVNILDVTTL